jgi:hypothetical protein
MVRAILEGRKAQTRRAVKNPDYFGCLTGDCPHERQQECDQAVAADCPYGQPGDRLWVREAFSGPHCMEASEGCAAVPPAKWARSSRIWYWADGNPQEGDWTRPRPSIHMPRWASRITLEVTGVRVERLQDISRDDVLREGLPQLQEGDAVPMYRYFDMRSIEHGRFRDLWESLNGDGSWAANPWVWVVEFRRVVQEAKAA